MRSTASCRSAAFSTRGCRISRNSRSGNCASSAWTRRCAVSPVASEIMCSSTAAIPQDDRLSAMPAGVVHWDEVDAHRRAKGEMDAEWQWLGRAAGCVGVGVNRVRVAPGRLPTPPHSHGASEELYYVLSGSGLAWQDDVVHEVRPGDCVIHRADEHEHTFVGGPDRLQDLVFATNYPTELGWLPRSRAIRLGWPWVEGRTDDPWDVEASVPPLEVGDPAPRPANIVNVDEVEHEPTSPGVETAPLATDERSVQAGLPWGRLDPGRRGPPPPRPPQGKEGVVDPPGGG